MFFPNVGEKSLLLLDLWTGHSSQVLQNVNLLNKDVNIMIIPKGTTGKIQPLDVFAY